MRSLLEMTLELEDLDRAEVLRVVDAIVTGINFGVYGAEMTIAKTPMKYSFTELPPIVAEAACEVDTEQGDQQCPNG